MEEITRRETPGNLAAATREDIIKLWLNERKRADELLELFRRIEREKNFGLRKAIKILQRDPRW